MDAKRYNRHVVIEQTSPTLKITFMWREGESEFMGDMVRYKELEFFPQMMQTACQSLAVFFKDKPDFLNIAEQVFISSGYVDHMSYYFDGVVDSDNPEQVFISRYILEDALAHAEGYKHGL